jgi:hypothetical protein
MPPKRVNKPASGAGGGEAVPSFTLTTGSKKDPPAADDGTPTSPDWRERVAALEKQQMKSDGHLKSWFEDAFLQRALDEKLFPLATRTYPTNPNPTLFVMVGPASCGKSSAKRLIPGMTDVVNVDVDEVKLYGNAVLKKHQHLTKSGVMLSDVEGIQFKYPEVLFKLKNPVFRAATTGGRENYKNIILDTTGGMTDIIKTYIRTAARTFGYTVKVIIVYSDRESCMDRVKQRNQALRMSGEDTRYIPPPVIGSIYDGFMKNRIALFYALNPRMIEIVDELILVDNRGAIAKIIASRTRERGVVISPDGEGGGGGADSLLNRPGAFYGLTIQTNPPAFVDPNPPKGSGGGGSRKRRIITRRRQHHYTKKTIKNRRCHRSRTRRRRYNCK